MGKLTCECGNILSDSLVPNDVRIWAYTDQEWEMINNTIKDIKEIPLPKNEVWYCVKCKRIHIYNEDYTKLKIYVLEKSFGE